MKIVGYRCMLDSWRLTFSLVGSDPTIFCACLTCTELNVPLLPLTSNWRRFQRRYLALGRLDCQILSGNILLMVTERQRSILETLVSEHIERAQPISSQLLEQFFNVSPATIRNELHELTEAGFLYQPHTSAGRVPTDKGYRFFLDALILKKNSAKKKTLQIEKNKEEDEIDFLSSLLKEVSVISSNLAGLYLQERDLFWKEGWEKVLREPEFNENSLRQNFLEFLEDMERGLQDFSSDETLHIYIGKENPFSNVKDFTAIVSELNLASGKGFIALLGPKRMSYEKNLELINEITRVLS